MFRVEPPPHIFVGSAASMVFSGGGVPRSETRPAKALPLLASVSTWTPGQVSAGSAEEDREWEESSGITIWPGKAGAAAVLTLGAGAPPKGERAEPGAEFERGRRGAY